MTKKVLIEGIEADELLTRLDKMESAINALNIQPQNPPPATQSDFITRAETASLFRVTLTTINDWAHKGILKAYKVGNRVYFKRAEVNNALVHKGGKYVQG